MSAAKNWFPNILAAVKPQQRTDQYVILAALYHLRADRSPVPVGDINKVLSLHLRNKAPQNVANSLRKYTKYVSPVDDSRPLRWHLLEDGIDRLRTLSKLALTDITDRPRFESDIGIVCALEQPEFEAVQEALGGQAEWKETGDARYTHVYRETNLNTDSGKNLKVVATASTSMGLTAAAIATTQLIMQFRPRIVVMIGIAAGTRSGGKEFGDVLDADPSVDYNSGKVVESDGIREFLPDPYPLGINATSYSSQFSGDVGSFTFAS